MHVQLESQACTVALERPAKSQQNGLSKKVVSHEGLSPSLIRD